MLRSRGTVDGGGAATCRLEEPWEDYPMKKFTVAASIAVALMSTTAVSAAELEVTHWWTSAGEAASIAEFARIFEEETGHTWVDSALGGSGTGANPVIISRIIGGDPMGATQMNTGRDAEELIQAGLMRDLTDIAEEMNIRDFYVDESLLEPCTYEGRIYCFPSISTRGIGCGCRRRPMRKSGSLFQPIGTNM